jgi:moderate conductance mechanosensitive channel
VFGSQLNSFDPPHILSGLFVIGMEIGLVALVCGAVYAVARLILARTPARNGALAGWRVAALRRARRLALAAFLVAVAGLLAYNGWLIARGVDVRGHTANLVRSVDANARMAFGIALAKLAVAVVGLVLVLRLVRRLLQSAQRAVNRWDQLKANDKSLAALFSGLEHSIVNAAWMVLAGVASGRFGAPDAVTNILFLVVRIYLVIAVGILIIRCTTVAVDTLAGLSERAGGAARRWFHSFAQPLPMRRISPRPC